MPDAQSKRDQWERCLDRLYESVGVGDQLAIALGGFRELFDARGVSFLTTPDPRTQQTYHIGAMGVSVPGLIEYHSHYNVHDEWVKAAWARDGYVEGSTYRGSELVAPEALRASYFWSSFLSRYGVSDILTSVVEAQPGAGTASFISFMRHQDQQPFGPADVPRLAELTPHLRRALRLHRRLAPELALGSSLRELFLASDVPLLFVAGDGTLVECNGAAQAVLDRRDAVVHRRFGRLIYADERGWHEMADVLRQMHPEGSASFELELLSQGGSGATLEVRKVHAALTDTIAKYPIVALCTLRQVAPDLDKVLRKRFGLTPTEAEVARRLAEGRTAAQVGEAMQVRMSTIRTHIRNLLAKTGTQRQAQLVALVLAAGDGAN